jgi:N-acetylmuramoyl-L-alanine amidase
LGFVVMVVATFLAVATLFFAAEVGAQTTNTQPLLGKTVVIDPGHGGSDLGATYTFADRTKLFEKEQNLEVSYRLKSLLEASGATVYMTRYDNATTLTNTQRAEIANKAGANLLVSIHMNGSSDPKVDYTTTLFGKWQKDKAFAYALFGDNVNPPKINPPTYGLRTLPAANGTGNYIATRAPYSYASGVLLKSNMPAAIAETVFITNTDEARLLSNDTGQRQQQIAEALKTGIVAYLSK